MSAVTHLKTLLAATAALATTTSFATAQTATQIAVRAYELSDSLWYTPDTSPACQRDKEKCKIFSHRGRQTADDLCAPSFRVGDPVNNDWCDASWVSTENTNLTQYALQFDVTCTAFDRAVHVLGSGSTNRRGDEREGDDPGSAARQFNALPPAGSSRKSYVRLPKVKYDDVAHVECHAFEKGKNAIAAPSLDKIPMIINILITAVRRGELDEQLAQAKKPPRAATFPKAA